jgi:hypothetical protein
MADSAHRRGKCLWRRYILHILHILRLGESENNAQIPLFFTSAINSSP